MVTNNNGRYAQNDHEGAYNAGKAFGLALRDDYAPAVLLGADVAFRIVSQVFINRGDVGAIHIIDGLMASFVKGYQDGKG